MITTNIAKSHIYKGSVPLPEWQCQELLGCAPHPPKNKAAKL